MHRLVPIAAVLIVAFMLFSFYQYAEQLAARSKVADAKERAQRQESHVTATPPSNAPPHEIPSKDSRLVRFSDGSVHYQPALERSRQLHRSASTEDDLEIVSELLAHYRTFFKENPVGSENEEIVAQLLGDNALKTSFLDPKLEALGSDQILRDRWGSPLVFHPLSATVMGLRSPGADRKLWTEDDLVLAHPELESTLQLQAE